MNEDVFNKNSEYIELYFIDNNDGDKLKLCGKVKSIPILREVRNGSSIDVNGTFGYVRLDSIDKLFMQKRLRAQSQKHPLVAIITDIENNAKTIISCIWFKNIGMSYGCDNYGILENSEWEAESIISEKLDGTPFTINDIIERISLKRNPNIGTDIKNQFSIESDGTTIGTRVLFNNEPVSLVQNIKWETSVNDFYSKMTLTVSNVPFIIIKSE